LVEENTKLNDCFFETKDWRKCKPEMEAFKKCWAAKGNAQRVAEKKA
jgi:cytochrome c oxidase assembly factor 4